MAFNRNAPKINKLWLSKIDNANYSQVITEVVRVTDEIGAEELKIDKYYNGVFLILVAELQKAFKKMNLSTFTKLLDNADGNRDDAIYALVAVLKACLRSKNAEIRLAAQRLLDKLNSYGNLAEKGLDAQTASTNDLLDAYEADFADDITAAGVERWVDDVKNTNKDFSDLMTKRYKEAENKPDVKVREVRKELDEALRYLFSMVEILAITDGDEIYAKYIKSLNVVFARFGAKSSRTGKGVGDIGGDVPQEIVDYPDAPEWEEDLPFMGVENGDIYYILVDGKKVFYKLIDKQKFFWHPESEKAAGGWEKLN